MMDKRTFGSKLLAIGIAATFAVVLVWIVRQQEDEVQVNDLLMQSPVSAQAMSTLELIQTIPGKFWTVQELTGDRLIAIDGKRLVVYDINGSAASSPVELGDLQFEKSLTVLAVSGQRAFVGSTDKKVSEVDISDVGNMTVSSSLTLVDVGAAGLGVSGSHLIAAHRRGKNIYSKLVAIDVTSGMTIAGTIDIDDYDISDLAVSGTYAYVSLEGEKNVGEMRIYNVADPVHMKATGAFVPDGRVTTVEVVHNSVYAGVANEYGREGSIEVVDASAKGEPFWLARSLLPNNTEINKEPRVADLEWIGNDQVLVLERVSNPDTGGVGLKGIVRLVRTATWPTWTSATPTPNVNVVMSEASSLELPGAPMKAAVVGAYAYVACDTSGLAVVRLSP